MKIVMELETEFGTVTKLEQIVESSCGDEVDFLSIFINNFMKAATFSFFDKDKIILKSVTENEYEKIVDYLWDMRHKESKNNDK